MCVARKEKRQLKLDCPPFDYRKNSKSGNSKPTVLYCRLINTQAPQNINIKQCSLDTITEISNQNYMIKNFYRIDSFLLRLSKIFNFTLFLSLNRKMKSEGSISILDLSNSLQKVNLLKNKCQLIKAFNI